MPLFFMKTNKVTKENSSTITGKLTISKYKDGKLVHLQKESNKVVSSSGHGRNLLVRQLTGDTTYGIQIDEGKIGTDNTAPVDANTDLGTVTLDGIVVEASSFTGDECTFSFFILDASLPDDTYNEFGLFIGSQMFARAVFDTPYVKGANEDTRIDYQISISSN